MSASSEKALELIKHFESLHDGDSKMIGLQPKMCPAGIWTVGWGHALRHPKTGRFLNGAVDKDLAYSIFPSMTLTQADVLLITDLRERYEPVVLKQKIKRQLNNDQFGALVSFAYNCGEGYTNKQGQFTPYAIWKNVDSMNDTDLRNYWDSSVIKSGGQILGGLVRRRKAEAHLFLTGLLKFEF